MGFHFFIINNSPTLSPASNIIALFRMSHFTSTKAWTDSFFYESEEGRKYLFLPGDED